LSALDWITFSTGLVVVFALARMASLVPGFGDDTVRPMSHAIVVLGLSLLVLAGAVLLRGDLSLWLRVPASAMLAAWGATLTLAGRAADVPGHRKSRASVAGVPGLRRR
jgi:hypothetical protein